MNLDNFVQINFIMLVKKINQDIKTAANIESGHKTKIALKSLFIILKPFLN